MSKRFLASCCGLAVATGCGWILRAQDSGASVTAHANCTFFGPERERFLRSSNGHVRSDLTAQVTAMLGAQSAPPIRHAPPAPRMPGDKNSNLIDYYIWQAYKANGVTPAAQTTDYEFIRRIYLDLTGRIPTPAEVTSFVPDQTPNKRANLIDTLLASPEWVDRWTMFFGDLYKNASTWPSLGVSLSVYGRDAFNGYIRNALTNATPYNQVAYALISSEGTNNFTQGELNWIAGGTVVGTNIPVQDTWDQQTANIADTFLGISHLNCLLCHNGIGHLTGLSLWGQSTTRQQAWGVSAFLAHTRMLSPTDSTTNQRLWYVNDNAFSTDYPLNTTSGNRPPRQPIGGTQKTVAPNYIFTGQGPQKGERYRQALARLVTSDEQFARATVNYIWAAFFTMGLVDPPDQFDPARLDPNNPPPAGWTLQPSNPQLLEALTQDFIANNYDLKHLMRLIANSNAYQLESQYDPAKWNPNWESLFARKLVRRLWGEEVADSISLASNVPNNYTSNGVTFHWAMQWPETSIEQKPFLQAFLPGDRDLNPRRPDGAIQQALVMMNDGAIMGKLGATGTGASASLLNQALAISDNKTMIDTLFMTILSRHPSASESQTALALIQGGTRTARIQELMWTLYNKVDFLFNY